MRQIVKMGGGGVQVSFLSRWPGLGALIATCHFLTLAIGSVTAEPNRAAWLFLDFEDRSEFLTGPLKDHADLQMLRGRAEIRAWRLQNPGRHLAIEPEKGLFPILTIPLEVAPEVPFLHANLLVRPFATDDSKELLDFNGMLIGFTRNGEWGEVTVVHSSPGGSDQWLGTGFNFPLEEDGQSSELIELTICQNRQSGHWALWINGELAFENIVSLATEAEAFDVCYLIGYDDRELVLDDIFIGSISYEAMRRSDRADLATAAARESAVTEPRSRATTPIAQAVKKTRRLEDVRVGHEVPVQRAKITAYSVSVHSGQGVVSKEFRMDEPSDSHDLIAYSPPRSEDGTPLPMKVTIALQSELQPGQDISHVSWEIRVLEKWPDGYGEMIASGVFGRKLVQTAVIPPEFTRKATTINVGVTR